ncbi:hypothetical protein ACHAXS_003010, partial [Conticribra weissflogii]
MNIPRPPNSGDGNNGYSQWNRSRTTGRSPPSPRGRSADAKMTNSNRRASAPKTGLEPEERIIPIGGSGTIATATATATASHGLHTPQRAAPRSGPRERSFRYNATAEANSPNNPFVDASPPSPSPTILEFSASSTNNRQRSASDSWWREEIIEEALDKTTKMEDYYGLSSSEKIDLYGKSSKGTSGVKSKNPFEQRPQEWEEEYLTARRKAGYTTLPTGVGGNGAAKGKKKNKSISRKSKTVGGVAIGIGYNTDGSVESALVDIEQPQGGGAEDEDDDNDKGVEEIPTSTGMPHRGQSMMSHRQQHDPAFSIYEKATQIHKSGQYREQVPVVDDFSFSVVELPKANNGGTTLNNGPNGKNDGNNSNGNGFLQISKWFSVFAPGSSNASNNDHTNSRTANAMQSTYPPNITSETNIAPRLRGNSQEWWANSPRVTFDTEYHHQDNKLRWSQMNTTQKIGLAVVVAAVVCSIMGIAVSQMSGNGTAANTKDGDPGLSSG